MCAYHFVLPCLSEVNYHIVPPFFITSLIIIKPTIEVVISVSEKKLIVIDLDNKSRFYRMHTANNRAAKGQEKPFWREACHISSWNSWIGILKS